jgi:transcriptional regulator with XRE-family HTH domain
MAVIRGDRVRKLREAKHWNQKTLGAKVGSSQTTISDIEKGNSKEPGNVHELASALETSVDYLWGLTDDPRPVPKPRSQQMQLDRTNADTAKSQAGAITGDAQETSTVLSTNGRILLIYGTSSGGAGKMSMTVDPIDKVLAPGYAENVANAYYVKICTADMEPAYRPGDDLLIYPEHPIYAGRDYLLLAPKVEGEPQTCKLRWIDEITDTHWVCTVWAPTKHPELVPIKDYPIAHWVEAKRNR